ncbi:hypothetical protein FCM35_KLT15021 [Carex littledalei]|uniref:Uncharacterized protein n=1 Tax=Carex littledalei TaxID=544730 RepID=A0A833QH20_9POAL|nr:hypothetical protein FCM35_KLT15021 [Carex littledalei]
MKSAGLDMDIVTSIVEHLLLNKLLVCNRYYSDTEQACSALASTGYSNAARTVSTVQTVQHTHRNTEVEYKCFVDGSWSEDGRAGVGVYLTRQGVGIKWLSKSVQALGSSQAEARGVLEAYILMQKLQCNHGIVYSDSLETVDSLLHTDPRIHDWRSYDHIWSENWRL